MLESCRHCCVGREKKATHGKAASEGSRISSTSEVCTLWEQGKEAISQQGKHGRKQALSRNRCAEEKPELAAALRRSARANKNKGLNKGTKQSATHKDNFGIIRLKKGGLLLCVVGLVCSRSRRRKICCMCTQMQKAFRPSGRQRKVRKLRRLSRHHHHRR